MVKSTPVRSSALLISCSFPANSSPRSVWDSKPSEKGRPINWVELKTTAEIRGAKDMEGFHRKLMKYWIQSFLLGVPKIIVGFRTRDGILADVNEIQTHSIPQTVNSGPNPAWNADMCVNFAASFLECRCRDHTLAPYMVTTKTCYSYWRTEHSD